MASFQEFAQTLEEVRATSKKNEKVAVLAEYLKGLGEPDAEIAARFATGRPSPKGSADETQVGYSTIIEVLIELTGVSQKDVSASYLRHGDLGELAQEVLANKKETALFAGELTLGDVAESFDRLTRTKGSGSASFKRGRLKALLLRASQLEAKYLVKILTREMRMGLVDGLVEEAIASAYSLERAKVREAHLILGEIGALAREARGGRLQQIRPVVMRPTNFMLAQPMLDAKEVESCFNKEVFAEFKYDGVRAQLHKKGSEVRIFSRRLEDITQSFPEVVKGALTVGHEFILDGEIVPFKDGKPLPFQLLQRRLRRVEGVAEAAKVAPATYFCFDILLLDGAEQYRRPLRERKKVLEGLLEGTALVMAEVNRVSSEGEIARLFKESRGLGYEGLVVKDPESPYTPGRRGSYWAKLKEELDTLDVVIVGAEYGHGKRAGKISDYTFAVRDGSRLRVIGKAYSGLTDMEIEEMMTRIKALTTADHGYRRDVKPEIVLEVAFDSIQKSTRHDSGYALRFPRIKRTRDDKSVDEIDTIDKVKEIFEAQKVKV